MVGARLSEDPGLRVLVLEAGPDFPDGAPDAITYVRNGSGVADFDWDYVDPRIGGGLPRGRVVGGSSSVNATIALRGQPADYDRWVELGAAGWGWEDCLPYFVALEDDAQYGDAPGHGRGGPVPITRELPLLPAEALFAAACQELGHDPLPDLNTAGRLGVGPVPRNIKDGVRQGALLTHIAAARSRPNFELRGGALVDRVVFDGERATGVVLDDGSEVPARLVVLAGGAYNTPAMLLRSGIGPREELGRHGIDVRVDLPAVGRNLKDHPVTLLALETDYPTDPGHLRFPVSLKALSRPDLDLDDLKVSFYPGDVFNMPGLSGIYVEVNYSDSVGTVELSARAAAAPPAIAHRFLSDARDEDRLLSGARLGREIQEVMARTTKCEMLLPDAATLADDDLLREHLGIFHSAGYHPCGTCRMGSPGDADAVVDPRLRVRGASNLYVVDASVMPDIPRANLNLTTLMLAERGAAMIREDLNTAHA